MNRFSVMDGHCDTVYRCWAMGEELPYNTGALELGSALDTFGAYTQVFALDGPGLCGGRMSRSSLQKPAELFPPSDGLLLSSGDPLHHRP